MNCSECDEFYIGKTIRRLNTRLKEHMKDENSSLYRHSFLTDHVIDYCKHEILAKDSNVFRLCVKETLKIQDYYAHKSLNENTGSFKLISTSNYVWYLRYIPTRARNRRTCSTSHKTIQG